MKRYRIDVIVQLQKQITVEADSPEEAEAKAIEEADEEGWDTMIDYDHTETGSFIPLD